MYEARGLRRRCEGRHSGDMSICCCGGRSEKEGPQNSDGPGLRLGITNLLSDITLSPAYMQDKRCRLGCRLAVVVILWANPWRRGHNEQRLWCVCAFKGIY
jgi:hypothetical protein